MITPNYPQIFVFAFCFAALFIQITDRVKIFAYRKQTKTCNQSQQLQRLIWLKKINWSFECRIVYWPARKHDPRLYSPISSHLMHCESFLCSRLSWLLQLSICIRSFSLSPSLQPASTHMQPAKRVSVWYMIYSVECVCVCDWTSSPNRQYLSKNRTRWMALDDIIYS